VHSGVDFDRLNPADFRYLPFHLMDDDKELEADDNPIALVILAAQERERHRRKGERFHVKRLKRTVEWFIQ